MSPKEKAENIVAKFEHSIVNRNGITFNDSTKAAAIECAFICVSEIINTYMSGFSSDKHYWALVEKELVNL